MAAETGETVGAYLARHYAEALPEEADGGETECMAARLQTWTEQVISEAATESGTDTDAYVALLALEDLARVKQRLRYLLLIREPRRWCALAAKLGVLEGDIADLREQLLEDAHDR